MFLCNCALNISNNSCHKVSQHGAVIMKGKEIVAIGCNNENNHAETSAIYKALQRLL